MDRVEGAGRKWMEERKRGIRERRGDGRKMVGLKKGEEGFEKGARDKE